MDTYYTPIDVAALKQSPHKSFDINAIFLGLIVITLAILVTLLFILIQKKMQELALVGFIA